jgi:hypothetical protein
MPTRGPKSTLLELHADPGEQTVFTGLVDKSTVGTVHVEKPAKVGRDSNTAAELKRISFLILKRFCSRLSHFVQGC